MTNAGPGGAGEGRMDEREETGTGREAAARFRLMVAQETTGPPDPADNIFS